MKTVGRYNGAKPIPVLIESEVVGQIKPDQILVVDGALLDEDDTPMSVVSLVLDGKPISASIPTRFIDTEEWRIIGHTEIQAV